MNDSSALDLAPVPEAAAPATFSATARPNNPLRGIAYLCGGVFIFNVHDICVKWLSGSYPLTEVLMVRSATAAPLLLAVVLVDAGLRALASSHVGAAVQRAVTLLVGYLVYYMGLADIPFADATALYMSVPLVIVALAGPFLGERVGLMRWLAVLVGFLGVLIMLHPGLGVFRPAGLLILLCAFLYSAGMVMGRRLGATMPASVMAFYSNGIFLVSAGALGLVFTALQLPSSGSGSIDFLLRPWVLPTWHDLAMMITAGFAAAVGIALLTFAYREAEATIVASFEYTALIWAVIFGYVVWGDVPGAATVIGAALIVGAGLVALWAGRDASSAQQSSEGG